MATEAELVEAIRNAGRAGDGKAVRALGGQLQRIRAKKVKTEAKDTSFWQGVAEGVMPAAYNAAKVMNRINPVMNIANAVTGGSLDRSAERGRQQTKKRLESTGKRGTTGGRILGAMIGSAPTMAIPGTGWANVMAQGGAGGALLSEDIIDPTKAIPDAITGAATGALVKGGLDYAVAPIARRLANTGPVRSALNAIGADALTNAPKLTAAERRILKAKPDLSAARAKMQRAQELGLPYTPADADEALRALAGSSRRFASPGPVREAADFTKSRMAERSARGLQAIERDFGNVIDPEAASGQIRNLASRRADPFYQEAFEGGSTAPLEAQFTDAFNTSSQNVAQARANLAAAQRGETLSRAAVNRAGDNVYMNAKALPADRTAGDAIKAAERQLADAEAAHEVVLQQLRRAQGDASSNAPGAVWSPRIQQFIDDPLSKAGLARGLEIQRIEALAKGEPFNPTEYAITGFDEAGAPIVGNVPNLRTLDAIKKGYDAILDEYPRDITGKQIFDQRGRAITMAKQALVKELDTATGGAAGPYAQARGVYGDIISRNTALTKGQKAALPSTESRTVAKQIEGMDPKQAGMYRRGFVTENVDAVRAARADTANPYDYLAGGLDRKDKLGLLFPETTPRFLEQRAFERDMADTATELFGGSQTQPRAIADQNFRNGAVDMAIDGASVLASGGAGALPMAARAAKWFADKSELGLLGSREKADALLPLLTSPGATGGYDQITGKLLAEEAQREAWRRAMGMLTAPAIGGLLAAP